MDRDEPRFAQATWEMMERKEWFIPYFNGQYRFDKPVLSYWWMRVHDSILGKTELASRLHSVLAAILSALVLFEIGKALFSWRTGFWAGVGWLSCFQVLIHGRLCVADMPMLLGVTLAFWGMLRLLEAPVEPVRWGGWFWVFSGGLAFGFLAKGPIALAVPLVAFLLARFGFYRAPIPWRRLQPVSLTMVVLLMVGLWGIPALIKTNGKFWDEGMGEHVVHRGMEAFNGRVRIPVLYYLFFANLSLLPWSAFWPAAWPKPGQAWKWERKEALLLGWLVGPVLIFSLYATQLPHYILPGFPAFFLLLFRNGPEALSRAGRWFWILVGSVAVPAVAVALAASRIEIAPDAVAVRTIVVLGALLFVCMAGWAVLIRFQRWRLALGAVALGGLLTHSLCGVIHSVHPAPQILEAFDEIGARPRELRAWGYEEPNLVFYVTHPVQFKRKPAEIATSVEWALKKDGTALIFLLREWRLQDQIDSVMAGRGFARDPSRDDREAIAAALEGKGFAMRKVKGFNVARASWVELIVCVPGLP
jgi:4-amino-4-deoxy-L-arabinose transferase-like glycosyltransferase